MVIVVPLYVSVVVVAWVSPLVTIASAQACAFAASVTLASTSARAPPLTSSMDVGSGPTLTDSWRPNHGSMSCENDCSPSVAEPTSWSSDLVELHRERRLVVEARGRRS